MSNVSSGALGQGRTRETGCENTTARQERGEGGLDESGGRGVVRSGQVLDIF